MWTWIPAILLCLFDVTFAEAPPCPPSSTVYPCSCSNDGYLTSINCDGVRSIDTIRPILTSTRGKNMSYAFMRSSMAEVPSDLFEGQSSVNLHFENCRIGSFGDKPFTGLEDSLARLYVYGSVNKRRKDLETFRLGHLRKLEDLSFLANDIKRLGNDWFEGGPESLKQLNLEANDIEELGDKAFTSLVNVEQIWMGDNSFKRVARSMFPNPANKLWLLEMSFSGIEELPEDIFEGMPVLRTINVMGNKLKSLPEATWGKIWDQLDEVYLERNSELQCDEKIKWIYQRKKQPKMITGKCTDEKHYGKKLEDLTLADFD